MVIYSHIETRYDQAIVSPGMSGTHHAPPATAARGKQEGHSYDHVEEVLHEHQGQWLHVQVGDTWQAPFDAAVDITGIMKCQKVLEIFPQFDCPTVVGLQNYVTKFDRIQVFSDRCQDDRATNVDHIYVWVMLGSTEWLSVIL